MLAWIDIETTGLNPEDDEILEIACVVTEDNLERVAVFSHVVKPFRPYHMEPIVREMHTKNGLLDVIHTAEEFCDVRDDFRDFVELNARGLPLAGSTVSFDRSFLRSDMPDVERLFHYRNVDVSSVKELCRRWRPDIYEKLPPGRKTHRALLDIEDSIGELKFYRDHFLQVT